MLFLFQASQSNDINKRDRVTIYPTSANSTTCYCLVWCPARIFVFRPFLSLPAFLSFVATHTYLYLTHTQVCVIFLNICMMCTKCTTHTLTRTSCSNLQRTRNGIFKPLFSQKTLSTKKHTNKQTATYHQFLVRGTWQYNLHKYMCSLQFLVHWDWVKKNIKFNRRLSQVEAKSLEKNLLYLYRFNCRLFTIRLPITHFQYGLYTQYCCIRITRI